MLNHRYSLIVGSILLIVAVLLRSADEAVSQGTPTPGVWSGTVAFEADSGLASANITFQIDGVGQVVDGAITLKFSYPTMSAELLELMLEYGCVVPFDTFSPEGQPVAGSFTSNQSASGTFSATRCSLQGYGDLEFMDTITGTWTAAPIDGIVAIVSEDTKPTRIPTLDPNQPTPKPTRIPTLDPNQPTPAASIEEIDQAPSANLPDEQPVNASPGTSPADAETATTVMMTAGEDYPYDPSGPHVTDDMSARKMYKEFCEECHGQQGIGTQDAPELEALNASRIAETVRDGPEDMDVFTHEDIPDRALNKLIDYVLLFHPDSEPRTGTVVTLPTKE